MTNRHYLLLPRLCGIFMFFINVNYYVINGKNIMHRVAEATHDASGCVDDFQHSVDGKASEIHSAGGDALMIVHRTLHFV
jgi:hypothetical protein